MSVNGLNLVEQFIQELPQEVLEHHINDRYNCPGEDGDDQPVTDDFGFEAIINGLQGFIADLTATLINAGSERDCIMEDDALNDALKLALHEWLCTAPGSTKD